MIDFSSRQKAQTAQLVTLPTLSNGKERNARQGFVHTPQTTSWENHFLRRATTPGIRAVAISIAFCFICFHFLSFLPTAMSFTSNRVPRSSFDPLSSSFPPPTIGRFLQSPRTPRPISSTSLLGIKGFRAWFESQFPSAMTAFSEASAHEEFDHVLIDVNQMLHTSLRKSSSETHGLLLFFKELDRCLQMATPTKSLVLAMDGPPGASKLSTQRQRRKGVLVRSATRTKRIERVLSLGKRKLSKRTVARQKRKASAEIQTLSITPGTEFMEKAAHAILYWAWQRMCNPQSPLHRVQIFLSPSTVPGEGEVKLLEWIYTKRRKDSSIAIMSGDADLVLEGLIVPPTSTHDIFVLLPESSQRYLSVSLWETTRSLQRDYIQHMTMSNMMKIRTDLVVLFILNGNDYLPKLRRSSGFSKLFEAYRTMQNKWNDLGKADDAYLIHPDSLKINIDFCIDFFLHLASVSQNLPPLPSSSLPDDTNPSTSMALIKLYSFSEAGILPRPIRFSIIDEKRDKLSDVGITKFELCNNNAEEDENTEGSEDARHNATSSSNDNHENFPVLRLTVGTVGTDDFYAYDLRLPNTKSKQMGKHRLAEIAVCDLLGPEILEDDIDDDEDGPISSGGYDWEIPFSAESNVKSYLYGILWNLQTYQDGVCADYAYNYGKRKSPYVEDIVDFLKEAQAANESVGADTLSPGNFTPPISAALSCLAALPSEVQALVPEPYRHIPGDIVEDIYSQCIDSEDNRFNITTFHNLCEREVLSLNLTNQTRPIITAPYISNYSWTVMSVSRKPLAHPVTPPPPFDPKMTKLRRDRRIRITQYPTIVRPRQRDRRKQYALQVRKLRDGTATATLPPIRHSSPGKDFLKFSIEDVPHRSVYTRSKAGDLDTSNYVPTLLRHRTKDNIDAMSCLKQLEDAGAFSKVEWHTAYSSSNRVETVSLQIHGSRVIGLVGDIEISQDRRVHSRPSKRLIQHHLASTALDKVFADFEKNWKECTFAEIKSIVIGERLSGPRLRDLHTIVQHGSTAPHLWTVWVHGLDSSCDTWKDTLATAASFPGNSLVVDQRGCGRSPLGDPGDFSLDALVEDLHRSILTNCASKKKENKYRLVLVGHSLGARVALSYAARYPNHVAAVVMEDMDIAVRNPDAPGVLQLKPYRMPFVQSFPSQQAACQALQDVGYPASFVDKFVRSGRIYPGHGPGGWWSAVNPDFRRLCYMHILNTTHAREDWCNLATNHSKMPCHVLVAGPEGTVCVPESIAEMQALWPEAQVHQFANDTGHSLHSTAPDAYQSLLRQIIEQAVVDSRSK